MRAERFTHGSKLQRATSPTHYRSASPPTRRSLNPRPRVEGKGEKKKFMIITYSKTKNAVPIRLSQERWSHITRRHPELGTQRERVIETVSNPDLILSGDFGELLAIRLYPETPLTRKYLVVAYREESAQEGFVITGYFTDHTEIMVRAIRCCSQNKPFGQAQDKR